MDSDKFWDDAYQEDLEMRSDPEESAEFDAEVAAWDCTLLDGLADSPWEEPGDLDERAAANQAPLANTEDRRR